MAENAMNNISGIEMGSLIIDSATPTNCIMIQTRRNKYCFRLSESFPAEKQYEMFRNFVVDVNTPMEQPKAQEVQAEQPVQEHHDGAPLFDETIPAPTNVEIATQD